MLKEISNHNKVYIKRMPLQGQGPGTHRTAALTLYIT